MTSNIIYVFPVNVGIDSFTNSASSVRKSGRICFGKLMKKVIEKQEELQLSFPDTTERREKDRRAIEEVWRASSGNLGRRLSKYILFVRT